MNAADEQVMFNSFTGALTPASADYSQALATLSQDQTTLEQAQAALTAAQAAVTASTQSRAEKLVRIEAYLKAFQDALDQDSLQVWWDESGLTPPTPPSAKGVFARKV